MRPFGVAHQSRPGSGSSAIKVVPPSTRSIMYNWSRSPSFGTRRAGWRLSASASRATDRAVSSADRAGVARPAPASRRDGAGSWAPPRPRGSPDAGLPIDPSAKARAAAAENLEPGDRHGMSPPRAWQPRRRAGARSVSCSTMIHPMRFKGLPREGITRSRRDHGW